MVLNIYNVFSIHDMYCMVHVVINLINYRDLLQHEMTTQIKDFLYNYRPQDDENFQTYISGKYEFSQLASDTKEPIPIRGERFKHQEFIVRFMKIYDKALLMHDTGTGKTCTALATAQEFKHEWFNGALEYANTYINGSPGNIHKVYIFTKSETLENEFRHQLVCKCTAYEEYEARLAKTKQGRGSEKALTLNLRKYFVFKHYRSFANEMKNINPNNIDQVLRDMFENTMFILDEVQDLITEDDRENQTIKNENRSAYDMIKKISHICKNIKIICASATPMIDKHTEIVPVMNLILPPDMQMTNAMVENNPTPESLEPYFRGRVSYVRALDTGAVPHYMGDPLREQDNFKVWRSYMSPNTIHGQTANKISGEKDAYRSKARQAGLFVFPDGSIGKDGMQKYFNLSGGKYEWSYAQGSNELRDSLLGDGTLSHDQIIDNVYQFSPKYWTGLKLLQELEGSHFMYFNFVGVGTNLFSILLDLLGYERYNPSSSSFSKIQTGGKLKYCSDDSTQIITNLPKAKRYAIITSKTKHPELILELMNSPINMHGEYIKVLLVSEVAKTGINVSNILHGHLMDPAWNQSTAYQALSRFIRSTSHVDLIKDIASKQGISTNDVKIDIDIYQHCLEMEDYSDTIDKTLYGLCIDKDRTIRKIFRILKQCAFDCQVHRKRNIRDTDEDYSPICDYDTCNYPCIDPPTEDIDYTSYNTIYSGDEVEKIEEEITRVFKSVSFIKYFDLIDLLMDIFGHDELEMRMLADRAIRHIVEERKILRDRYNFVCYLREDKDDLFIQREYPTGNNDSSLSLYSSRLIGVRTRTIDKILKEERSVITTEIIAKLDSLSNDDKLPFLKRLENVFVYCNTLNVDLQVSILEYYLTKYGIDDDRSNTTLLVVKTYIFNIFWFEEPVAQLEEQRLSVDKRKLQEASLTNKPLGKKKTIQTGLQQYGGLVYVHNLNPTTGVLYAETSRSKTKERLRIMTSYEKVFRDPDPFELKIYSEEIGIQRARRNERFDEYPIYGSYSYKTNAFRLIMNYKNTATTDDRRSRYRGTICKSYPDKKNIVNIAIDLDVVIPIIDQSSIYDKKNYLIDQGFNITNRTDTEVERMYEMAKPKDKYTASDICDLILDKMVDKDMVTYAF